MTTIGTFTRKDDAFTGSIKTLALDAKITITPVEKNGDNAPDYRVFAGKTEIGAGWVRTSKGGRDYVSLKLDDPAFAAPLYANLVERDGSFNLLWNR
ncbi:MAG: DUF736 domain-containing protein [Planctomycetes bacterium]|nr:DUF736 domain-containing protein [Planctomycetota bacterium]